jgi:branched-chain amino acid transport system permease protein
MSTLAELRNSRRANWIAAGAALVFAIVLPLFLSPLDGFIDRSVIALAYVVMALGLNVVVGFAGLLDLGYVAFYAIGAYSAGWFASDYFSGANNKHGVHILVQGKAAESSLSHTPTAGIHLNFLIVLLIAVCLTALAGMIIGLPTLRLRGDYIAIVTLAFGEIVGTIAVNGDQIAVPFSHNATLTNGQQAISPLDPLSLPVLAEFNQATNIRPFYWVALALVVFTLFVNFRLRDSRLGRAWIALREDEVAAASMGVPLVRTKLLAYATGAALGGMAGAFLGYYINSVNAGTFEFAFSIFVLAMVILGGLGSIWGVVVGALALSYINYYLIPDVFNDIPSKLGLDFSLTQLSFGIFGFLLVIMMVLRPAGLIPERRRKLELEEGVGTGETELYEVRA